MTSSGVMTKALGSLATLLMMSQKSPMRVSNVFQRRGAEGAEGRKETRNRLLSFWEERKKQRKTGGACGAAARGDVRPPERGVVA